MIQFIQLKQITSGLPPEKKPTLLSQCWCWSASSQSQIRKQEDLVDSEQTECMFSSTVSLLGNHNDDGYEENVT